jgi:hypothetical protein
MAVLTDGQEWHFFLPTEQGDYGERRVYKLDLLERDPQEAEAGQGTRRGTGRPTCDPQTGWHDSGGAHLP